MLWRIFLMIVGTLVVIFIATQIWGLYFYGRAEFEEGMAFESLPRREHCGERRLSCDLKHKVALSGALCFKILAAVQNV